MGVDGPDAEYPGTRPYGGYGGYWLSSNGLIDDVSGDVGPAVCGVPRAVPIGTMLAPIPDEVVSCVAPENLDGLLESGDETGGGVLGPPGHLPSSSWKTDDPCGKIVPGRGPPIAGASFLPDTL